MNFQKSAYKLPKYITVEIYFTRSLTTLLPNLMLVLNLMKNRSKGFKRFCPEKMNNNSSTQDFNKKIVRTFLDENKGIMFLRRHWKSATQKPAIPVEAIDHIVMNSFSF